MYRSVFVGCLGLLISVIGALAQSADAKLWRDAARTALEGRIRQDFEQGKKIFSRNPKREIREASLQLTRSTQ